MRSTTSFAAAAILGACLSSSAAASVLHDWVRGGPAGSETLERRTSDISSTNVLASSNVQNLNNGSQFVWLIQDTYDHTNFFDGFDFYVGDDPTHGQVNFLNRSESYARNYTYIDDNGIIHMKADDETWLAPGQGRDSVRISSWAQYNSALVILDLNHAPWGCAVWPAFWTLGSGIWPSTGEIDILEGVQEQRVNQISFHTGEGCSLTNDSSAYTGQQLHLDCQSQPGCSFLESNNASYGPIFDQQGGGAFAMKWDQDGIAVWSFYRAAVPNDINAGTPTPSNWGTPSAFLSPKGCDPMTYFVNHSIIFDITFCGDWAGSSYATSGCPGSCSDRVMDPSNFVNASWSINSLKVYKPVVLAGSNNSRGIERVTSFGLAGTSTIVLLITAIFVMGL